MKTPGDIHGGGGKDLVNTSARQRCQESVATISDGTEEGKGKRIVSRARKEQCSVNSLISMSDSKP